MKYGRIKNIAIIALLILCVGQTVQLWFGNSSIRSFFYSFWYSETSYTSEESLKSLVAPYRVVRGVSRNRYYIDYTGLDDSAAKVAGDAVISDALASGSYTGSAETSWTAILASKCLIFEYLVDMPSDVFTKANGEKSSGLSGKTRYFNQVAIIPSSSKSLTVYFINNDENRAYAFTVNSAELAQSVLAALADDGSAPRYTSSILNNYDIGGDNLFLAEFDEGVTFSGVTRSNPYGDILLSEVEAYVRPFFGSAANISRTNALDVFTYSSAYAVVKYYPNDVLEYTNSYAGTAGNTFEEAYVSADNILKKDTAINNELRLADYVQDDSGFTFYFDYSVNNFPVYFTKEYMSDLGLTHAVEIRVENGSVMKYRRYICAFTEDGSTAAAANDFISVVENVLSLQNSEEVEGSSDIEELGMVYKVGSAESSALNWYLEISGQVFTLPVS